MSSSLGKANGDGSKDEPFLSLQAALSAAKGTAVYACAEVFTEALVAAETATLYGGLDCANGWGYIGADKKTTWTAGADEIPLRMTGGADGSKLYDVRVEATDAALDGGSSIAAIVEGATVDLVRCEVVAGNGKAGLKGDTPSDSVGPTDSNDPAIVGNIGTDACVATSSQLGGDAKENAACPVASGGPVGGSGGNGIATGNAGNGADGQPTGLGGKGGAGEGTIGGWDCALNGAGQGGAVGAAGASGAGAQGVATLGMITTTGYLGVPGQPGVSGVPGQGGGGGGGAKGKTSCAGASGGGGGVGGCPGGGGLGGLAGGSSIALVSLGATIVFSEVSIQTGSGGDGGDGRDGQIGGAGGKGGSAGQGNNNMQNLADACDGGKGGQGGFGGKGGGGRGGHSIGMAFSGATAPSTEGATFTVGAAGAGGLGADAAGNGDAGVMAEVQGF